MFSKYELWQLTMRRSAMRSLYRLVTVPRHEVVNPRNIWNIIKTIVEFRDGLANPTDRLHRHDPSPISHAPLTFSSLPQIDLLGNISGI
jgi:hypothetical protein